MVGPLVKSNSPGNVNGKYNKWWLWRRTVDRYVNKTLSMSEKKYIRRNKQQSVVINGICNDIEILKNDDSYIFFN